MVYAVMAGKAASISRFPMAFGFSLNIFSGSVLPVVVYNNLVCLPVSLPWRKDHSSCVFKHGHEIWHYDGLCKQVFVGAEEVWPLPFPLAFFRVVVSSVASP